MKFKVTVFAVNNITTNNWVRSDLTTSTLLSEVFNSHIWRYGD